MAECAKLDCHNHGTRHPTLLLLPENNHDIKPVEFVLGIMVCDEHQKGQTAQDFIADDGWDHINKVFVIVWGSEPDRSNVGLAWRLPELSPAPRKFDA